MPLFHLLFFIKNERYLIKRMLMLKEKNTEFSVLFKESMSSIFVIDNQ